MSDIINSKEYWEDRFKGDWEKNKGNEQSSFFTEQAMSMMPIWLIEFLKEGKLSACDWGCAEGDGTNLLAKKFKHINFTGIDFSENAIRIAKNRFKLFKNLKFLNVNLLEGDCDKRWDVLFSSNAIEHFSDPFTVIDELSSYANKLLVFIIPFNEDRDNLIPEHFHSFSATDFKIKLKNWSIVHFSVKDLTDAPDTRWVGSQAVVVYARDDIVSSLDISVDDINLNADVYINKTHIFKDKVTVLNKELDKMSKTIETEVGINKTLVDEVNYLRNEHCQLEQSLSYFELKSNDMLADISEKRKNIEALSVQLSTLIQKNNNKLYVIADRMAGFLDNYKIVGKITRRIARPFNKINLRLNKNILLVDNLIKEFDLFDPVFYLNENIDVKKSGINPREHYLKYGYYENRRPGYKFNPSYYIERYPDVAVSGMNPVYHYCHFGKKEGRKPNCNDMSEYDIDYKSCCQNWSNQKNYLSEQFDNADCYDINLISKSIKNLQQPIVVMPLSYPLDMVQRPDHIFRYFHENGIICVMLNFNDNSKEKYFKEHTSGVFVTNMVGAATKYLSEKNTILYITYPYYSFFVDILKPNTIIYDVLDEIVTFSGNKKFLEEEHSKLLRLSDLVLYSSKLLEDKNRNKVKCAQMLIENGVWKSDFETKNNVNDIILKTRDEELIIGYYGVVGDLLDWKLIETISNINNIRLVFIGPKANFSNSTDDQVDNLRDKVLSSNSVTYIDTVPYEDLMQYSSKFDAAIIPFVLNNITHAVSPLKLFEYMAAGHEIFATPTNTLSKYKKYINIADSELLVSKIKSWACLKKKHKDVTRYKKILDRVGWDKQLKPVLDIVLDSPNDKPFRGKSVDIVNVNFYDWKGKVLYKGGAERYVFDLAVMLREMGHFPRILQNSINHFEKEYKGIPVIGVETGENTVGGISKVYNKICGRADLIIASPMNLACNINNKNVIGINHGIYWDGVDRSLNNLDNIDIAQVFEALKNINLGICVDTNFINWVRTYDRELAKKLKYIPNYYDAKVFKPIKKDFNGILKFIYPRRLYAARGIYITIEAFNKLLNKYKDVELLFVGQTDDKDVESAVKKMINRFPRRVNIVEYDMEDMNQAYNKCQVALIPTVNSEGTSLSCLEAMATNHAIIATNVGGLPNLVIDGYNGFLIDTSSEDLYGAAEKLINDRHLVSEMSRKGLEMVGAFEKNKWDSSWYKYLKEVI